ncbi:hypothetical protein ACKVWC_011602 [Pyricularia oryzae]
MTSAPMSSISYLCIGCLLKLLHKVVAHRPHAAPLSVDEQRRGKRHHHQLYNAQPDEDGLGAVVLEPLRHEQTKHETVQDVLCKVERDERLARVLPVAVDAKGDRRRAAQAAAEADDAEENGRHHVVVAFLRAPAKTHQSHDGRDADGESHDEPELGLVQAAVAPGHGLDENVRHLARDCRAQNAADKGREVDETDSERVKVVVFFTVDDGHRLGDDDQPADRARVHGRRPENGRVAEQDKRAECDLEPPVIVEPAVPRAELLDKGLGFALTPVVRVDVGRGLVLLLSLFGVHGGEHIAADHGRGLGVALKPWVGRDWDLVGSLSVHILCVEGRHGRLPLLLVL